MSLNPPPPAINICYSFPCCSSDPFQSVLVTKTVFNILVDSNVMFLSNNYKTVTPFKMVKLNCFLSDHMNAAILSYVVAVVAVVISNFACIYFNVSI